MQIQVERVAVKPKVFDSGDEAWGVFSNNVWTDIFGLDHKPERGEVLEVDKVNVVEKNGRTFRNARVKPSPKQVEKAKEVLKPVITATRLYPPEEKSAPITHGESSKSSESKTRTTPYTQPIEAWEKVINRGFEIAGLNGITDDAARVSLVAIFAIPFGEGKLSIDNMEADILSSVKDDWGDRGMPNAPDIHDGWGDRDWTDGPPQNKQEWPTPERQKELDKELKDREMEAAKARMDKFVKVAPPFAPGSSPVEKLLGIDYKTRLGVAIKDYCAKKDLDFNTQKLEVLWRCANTRKLEGLSQDEAKIAIFQLGKLP